MISELCASLTHDNLASAVRVASLPDMVRGYEDLKVRRIGEYRAELSDALVEFRGAGA